MHSKHLLVNNQKMSKSKGNFFTLRSLLDQGTSAMAIRYLYVTSQYNHPLNFTLADVERAERTVKGLYDFLQRIREIKAPGEPTDAIRGLLQQTRDAFTEALDDDLNTPSAVESLFVLEREVNKASGSLNAADARALLDFYLDVDRVLGLKLDLGSQPAGLDSSIEALIAERNAARKAKNFKRSDEIRDELKAQGILLEDTAQGTRWKVE
jgi:cysteinyl-tRNA synthetase